jgi:(4S)-4-hydroxy-5-phosphonooxypentane-2,3-dione isomerase
MISLTVIIEFDPAKLDEATAAILANAEASRQEPGCLRFEVARQLDKPNVIVLSEVYQDSAAIDAHMATQHFAAWRAGVTANGWILSKTSVRAEVIA